MSHGHKHPLRAFRDANGQMSQEAAAALVGISQAMWSLLEKSKKHASPKLARRIAQLTGVSEETLMDFGDNESAEPVGTGSRKRL